MPYKPTGRPPGRPRKQIILPPLGEKPDLKPEQWKALSTELKSADWSREPWPCRPSLRKVANIAGVSRETVRKWRLDPLYLKGLHWLAAQELIMELKAESSPQPERTRSKRQSDALLHVYLKTNWSGPTVSPLDGNTYDNADDYFRHVQAHPDAVWTGDLPGRKSPK